MTEDLRKDNAWGMVLKGYDFDVAVATDMRFPGGSSASTLEEILVQSAQGWRTALVHLTSPVLKRRRAFHKGIANALISQKAHLANLIDRKIRTKVLLFRHPSIIHNQGKPLPEVDADYVLLVVNHPPINSRGRIDYILPYAIKRLRETYGVAPHVYPIGPLVRSAIEDMYGDTVKLRENDWVNIFDIAKFQHDRQAPEGRAIRIGRHSRPGKEKWPDKRETLRAAYPEEADVEVHILGGSAAPEEILGCRPGNWVVNDFGTIQPERFLKEIDVFVYFHHPQWVESFGRVIVEAMASGLPVIVPHHFKPLLGDSVMYCAPEEVSDAIRALRDKEEYMKYSRRAASYASENFSHVTHKMRLAAYGLKSVVESGYSDSVSARVEAFT